MRELGIFLRQAREEKHMTLAEAADKTKIRQAYLEAIEAGDLASLPEDPVYVRGFVRIYAKVLGLDPDQAAKMYDEGGKVPEEEPIAEYRSENGQRQSILEKRRALRRKQRIRFAVFVVVIVAAFAAYYYYYYYMR